MKKEKIFKTIIFIVVLLIPLIYSFFYLKSYWDPYSNLDDMKIAIVNLDKGDGTTNRGSELITELEDQNVLKVCNVNADDATNGIKNGEYYAQLTIPENFSDCLKSASEDDKKVASIVYIPNQKKNYLASQIINKVVTSVESSLKSKVAEEVTSTLADNLKSVPENLQKISDGTDELANGAGSLNSGIGELQGGVSELNSKYAEFDNGVQSAYEGSKSIKNGVSQVNSGVDSLSSGSTELDSAMTQINSGVDTLLSSGSAGIQDLNDGLNSLYSGTTELDIGVQQYVLLSRTTAGGTKAYVSAVTSYKEKVDALLDEFTKYKNENQITDPKLDTLLNKANQISNTSAYDEIDVSGPLLTGGSSLIIGTSDKLATGASDLKKGVLEFEKKASGLSELSSGLSGLKVGVSKVKTGTTTLNNGLSTLKNGTNALAEGSGTLTSGLNTLKSNSSLVKTSLNTLNDGTNQLNTGSNQLVDGITLFKTQISEGLTTANAQIEKLNGLSDYTANPVKIDEQPYGEVNSYGVAFTPLFISIGLWVGGLMCYVVLYFDQKNRFGILGSHSKNVFWQNVLYLVIGLVEGLLTAFILHLTLGFEPTNALFYYASSALISVAFMSIIQCLIKNLGDIGKFLALIILVLQLAAAGGTFPVETIDKGFQGLHALLPMTYSIDLLRDCLIKADGFGSSNHWIILILFTVGALAITSIVDLAKLKKEKEKENQTLKN